MEYDNGPKNNNAPEIDLGLADLGNFRVAAGEALATNELIRAELDGAEVRRGPVSFANSVADAEVSSAGRFPVAYNAQSDQAPTPARRGGITSFASEAVAA